jgi:hypothetical protein
MLTNLFVIVAAALVLVLVRNPLKVGLAKVRIDKS